LFYEAPFFVLRGMQGPQPANQRRPSRHAQRFWDELRRSALVGRYDASAAGQGLEEDQPEGLVKCRQDKNPRRIEEIGQVNMFYLTREAHFAREVILSDQLLIATDVRVRSSAGDY
jgi:hypothetical protein